jgi:signal transduction histidine kinase
MNTEMIFPKLSEYQMQCARDVGEELNLRDGQVIFREGADRADFFVILEGVVKVTRKAATGEEVLALHQRGEFMGTTDLLSGEPATATGYALGPARVARVPARRFSELMLACPEMRELMIPALAGRRAMEFASTSQQQKLAALGKLSAGLAHELNNPAAAASRSAQTLTLALNDLESMCCDLLNSMMSKEAPDGVPMEDVCKLARREGKEIDPMIRSDREEEMSAWLSSFKMPEPWEAAASLVSAGLSKAELEPLASRLSTALATKMLAWLAKDVEMRQTCVDLQESTHRISDIVGAMKSYTHMDQAQAKAPTDLHRGIDVTLKILKHKAKQKNITITREYGQLSPVLAFGGELNQVWTNLLDNAIYAAPQGGHIRIRTAREADQAMIEITDDGPGIPPEVRPRIFEPFFTTKGVGEGTGMGLDTTYRIVKDYGGDIRFDSRPGETRFTVRLPLAQQ